MELKIDINDTEIKNEALATAKKLAQQRANDIVNVYFRDQLSFGGELRHSKGVGFILIEEQVNKLLESDELKTNVEAIVREKFDSMRDKVIEEAMMHWMRRTLFTNAPSFLSKGDNEEKIRKLLEEFIAQKNPPLPGK